MEDLKNMLRDKAMSRMPNIPREATDYLVAVATHKKTPAECLPTDFMWFKCRASHAVSKIRGYYEKKTSNQVSLQIAGRHKSDTVKLCFLDNFGDHLIVFHAVESQAQKIANAASESTRSPLQPLNRTLSPKANEKSAMPVTRLDKGFSNWDSLNAGHHIPQCHSAISRSNEAVAGAQTAVLGSSDILSKRLVAEEQKDIVAAPNSYEFAAHHEPRWQARVKDEPRDDPYAKIFLRLNASQYGSGVSNHSAITGVAPSPAAVPAVPAVAAAPVSPLPLPNAAQNKRLQNLIADASPEELEDEVQASVALLDQIKQHLLDIPTESMDAQQWVQQIETLKQRNQNEPTIIGVVGNTGAGKSSVINAMLDEERLVPTNCMRACTAVVTEMSWNLSEDENARYRAEIEFIQPEDWEKELKILFAELIDADGKVSREAYNQESEAGVAYAKIKAVYPHMTKEDIANSSVARLMQVPVIRNVLGTTKAVKSARSDMFYRTLQSYVDSKEKTTDDKKQKKEMEYWPLIKVVKIYTKSDALSTGAVVVDLPGVHDSNAARSAIAQNYIKMCTGLWIVAPITRAVDDKAAKSLLGESFKRQLKYDGTYSRVTFICSKTDDISITEASDSLGLEEQISSKWDKSDQIERDQKHIKNKMKELRDNKAVYGEVLSDTDDLIDLWDKLKDDVDDGKPVYHPSDSSKKRKNSGDSSKQRKRRTASRSSDDDEDSIDEDSAVEDDTQVDKSTRGEPLTAEIIDAKMIELKETKKEARLQRRELDAQILALKDDLKVLDSEYDKLQAEMSAVCIAGRNQYSKGAIQQDFAAGIKELDQENQIETNEAEFNPDEDIRDYAEVARSLPVFCVSSRAYQKLRGRLQRDKDVPGFTTAEETEVPQLQAHCKKLTEAGRIATCRRFLNAFSQLMNSMSLWASNDGTGICLSDAQMAVEAKFLQSKLAQLEKGLERVVQDCLKEMKETLAENIYDKFDQVVTTAVSEANTTVAKWGAPYNRGNREAGGLHWGTYKAVCRRDGVFNNGTLHDFNLQLTEPIIKQLGSHWEKAFARRMPHVLQSVTKSSKKLLQSFHEDIHARVMKTGTGIAGLAMLGQQLQTYERIFQDLTGQMLQVITERQRDANREFTPVIARQLLSAYQYCAAERGTGSYIRMKQYMTAHVDQARQTMFHESTEEVKKHLTQMCRQIEEQMLNKTDEVFVLMRRDYMTVITGAHVSQDHQMPKWERQMKAAVVQVLQDREQAAQKEDPEYQPSENGESQEAADTECDTEPKVKSEMDVDENSIPNRRLPEASTNDDSNPDSNIKYESPAESDDAIEDQIQEAIKQSLNGMAYY